MEVAHSLILTKLRRPFVRAQLVHRARLQEKIAQGLRGPLVLITAPAGFGKTTLMAASLANLDQPVAWLSLEGDDDRPGRFMRYLVAALRERDGSLGGEALQLMAAVQEPPPQAILTSLVNDLDAAGEDIVLVLDDYQFIKSPAVHQAVAFLVEHGPANFHLVIASRSDPSLPIARLRARGHLVEIRAADLRFTEPEASRFLKDVMGLELDEASAAALEQRTEGWAVGLQMAALSLRGREDSAAFIQGFSGTNRYILDYLLEEVLGRQAPAIRHFLLVTSILERLSGPLCDFLLSIAQTRDRDDSFSAGHSASALTHLERANLFLVPLDDERIWYRYHHLFADLLRAQLRKDAPGLVNPLHVRAAEWFEREGFIAEAVQHLFAAREYDRAADAIERYGPARLAEGDLSVLQLAERLPLELVLDRPELALHQAWLLITQGRIPEAAPVLRGLAGTETVREAAWMPAMIAAALAFLAPDAAPLPDYRLLEQIPAEKRVLRNAADLLYGMSLGRRGDIDGAVEVALTCLRREKETRRKTAIPTLAPFLTRLYLIQGRLQATVSLCREYLAPVQKAGVRFIHTAGSMKIDLGEALYERGRLEEAEQHIRDGLRDNEPWRNIMTDGFGLVALARVLQAKEEYAEALQVVGRLEQRLLENAYPREFDEALHTLKARVQLAAGNLEEARLWADRIALSPDFGDHQARYRLVLGRIRLAEGNYAEAEKWLAGKLLPERRGSQIARQLEADLLLAAAVAGQRRLSEALALIDASLSLAEPEGYLLVFLDAGEPVRDLLAAYLRSPGTDRRPYAHKMLDAFALAGQSVSSDVPVAPLVEPLTEREIEVLQLIALGKTNKAIAEQLIIAPGTVKAHTASIYRKLDVANRTEAVSRARQIGILS